jgi:hypothetical protein
MNGHPEFLELIAMSIDFDLTDEEFGRLSTHLARCPECRRAADELRGDATAIAAYPAPRLAPARSEQILRAALRTPRPQPRWGMLAVAAMLTTLGGGILFAGFQLINDDDATPSEPPPSLVAEASAPPSAEPGGESPALGEGPVDGPRVTPNTGDPTPTPDLGEIDFEFPLPYTSEIASIRVAPTTDGRLWASFRDGNGTVLALLDESGAGSPLGIPGAEDCVPHAVSDGSVRVLCAYSDEDPETCVDACYVDRVYAYSPNLDELPGFPVSLPTAMTASVDRHGARVVGTAVVLGFMETADDEENPSTKASLITVRDEGSVVQGVAVVGPEFCCRISPDGIGFGRAIESHDDGTQTSRAFAIDTSGMVAGWPIDIEGTASAAAFGPGGDVFFTTWVGQGSRIVRIRDATHSMSVDLPGAVIWDPSYDGPLPPLVGETGRTSVVMDDRILSFDGTGAALPGWPYEPETDWVERGECPEGDTGCQPSSEPPRLAPRGLVYALESAPDGGGERITAVNADASVRSGWPKTLQRDGAMWDSVTIGENRIAYAVAIEPEPNNEASISILAFAPNGTREWIRTIVEP